ncbi:DBH-like monooxygenase protein 1 [Paramacrobiotus metropolitanus]|uniref:DBH-like monooxygenase protein 1 n=1 Tax=Paramacrobiotus metropolitanus TaxID=2943436 RepID=UPI002445C0E3|nr:DBH-like monooxygenase protein 1 [Paramacrobiotus metropolitanus]
MRVTLIFLVPFCLAEIMPLDHVHDTYLDAKKTFRLSWRYNSTHIEVQATVQTPGWLALGLSPDGNMPNSDVFVAWVNDTTGETFLTDRFLLVNRTARQIIFDVDPQQDWILIAGKQINNETTVTAIRALSTCDTKMDRNFTRDTLRVIWSYHLQDPADPTRIPHHNQRGYKSLLMFSQAFEVRDPMMDGNKLQSMSIRMDPVTIGNTTTTSCQCSMAKLPIIEQDSHIIAVRPQIKPGNEAFVRQISIYLCDEHVHDDFSPKDFDCAPVAMTEPERAVKNQYCRTLIAVWFSGNYDYFYPNGTGILLTKENSGRYVLMQVQYDNSRKTDFIDNSGLLLLLSNQIRTHNAGILTAGLLQYDYPLTVPPGVEDFVITSSCMDFCTQSIPASGIRVFSSVMNIHRKGRKTVVRVVRGTKSTDIDVILSDNNVDPTYPEARQPDSEITVLPGDRLIVECHYSTSDSKAPVFGGIGMDGESCLAYLSYYPAINLTSCGSRINPRSFLETTAYIPVLSDANSAPDVNEPLMEDANNGSLIRTYFTTKYDWNVGNIANLQYFYNSQKQTGVCSGNTVDETRYAVIAPYDVVPPAPETCIKAPYVILPKPQTITSDTKPIIGASDKLAKPAIGTPNNGTAAAGVRAADATTTGGPRSSARRWESSSIGIAFAFFCFAVYKM